MNESFTTSLIAENGGACVGEYIAGHRGKAERVVEFPVREQAGVGGDHRSSKLEHQPAVEIESENLGIRFTPMDLSGQDLDNVTSTRCRTGGDRPPISSKPHTSLGGRSANIIHSPPTRRCSLSVLACQIQIGERQWP